MEQTTAAAAEMPPVRTLKLHPLNDPAFWLTNDQFDAPPDVDILRCQREIDAIFGTTRGNQPILKLVWNGDYTFWKEYFLSWDANGKPNAPAVRRPRARYKTFYDGNGRVERDAFPPRWLILARLEPEQYLNYARESYFYAPEIKALKQIRPDNPPPVYWLPYATICKHNDYCCVTARKNRAVCYGEYVRPQFIYEFIGEEKRASQGTPRSPFAAIDAETIRDFENEQNGYAQEVESLKVEKEIYAANPMALIGPQAALKLGLSSAKEIDQLVEDYFNKKLNEAKVNK